jgi:hypothetical protein
VSRLLEAQCFVSFGADFFLAAVITLVSAELVAAARGMDGIGCKCELARSSTHTLHSSDPHVFGAINFIYGASSLCGFINLSSFYSPTYLCLQSDR